MTFRSGMDLWLAGSVAELGRCMGHARTAARAKPEHGGCGQKARHPVGVVSGEAERPMARGWGVAWKWLASRLWPMAACDTGPWYQGLARRMLLALLGAPNPGHAADVTNAYSDKKRGRCRQ
jgi:hypothetical protein